MRYVTVEELAGLTGTAAGDPRLARVADTASAIIDHYYGTATVNARLRNPDGTDLAEVPATVAEAALTIAGDVWRRPTTPGGYFQITDYVGRLAQDPTSSVVALLNALPGGRVDWSIA